MLVHRYIYSKDWFAGDVATEQIGVWRSLWCQKQTDRVCVHFRLYFYFGFQSATPKLQCVGVGDIKRSACRL